MNKLISSSVTKIVMASIALVITVAAGTLIGVNIFKNKDAVPEATSVSTSFTTPILPEQIVEEAVATNNTSQEDLLLYLIEEKKLAHDVYTKMYELYGARVVGNILKSEESHQGKVLSVLDSRSIADPRSSELGVFINSDLQALYNELIAKGTQSVEEAYKAGVIIEEKDIADITNQLATATDADIVQTLETLRSGSENHLRAFNRQINKY